MEDGPEDAEGSYTYGGMKYRLVEDESEVWKVFDGDTYLGVVAATGPVEGEPGPHYVAKLAGEENVTPEESTDDWRLALERLIDISR